MTDLNEYVAEAIERAYRVEYDTARADKVIGILKGQRWEFIDAEDLDLLRSTNDAAREVVESHTEVQELTATIGSFGPRFVLLGDYWVNPERVAHICGSNELTQIHYDGALSGITVKVPVSEVIARLTAEADTEVFTAEDGR